MEPDCRTGQLFRIYKKQDFDTQATLEVIHRSLNWRIRNLMHLPPPRPCSFLRFIPHPLTATAGNQDEPVSTQPILLLSLQNLTKFANNSSLSTVEKVEEIKDIMLSVYEVARMYLRDLDGLLQTRQTTANPDTEDNPNGMRIVQFVLMVDVKKAGMLPNLVC